MFSDQFYSILSEAQFATHQCVIGLRELAGTAQQDRLFREEQIRELRFAVHNGFFSLTTGVERLAKLTLSAAHYRNKGTFPEMKRFGHGVSKLYFEIQNLDDSLFENRHGKSLRIAELRASPLISESSAYIDLLDRYAQGSAGKGMGRYEYLDSLSSPINVPDFFDSWVDLTRSVSPEPDLDASCAAPTAVAQALYKVSRLLDDQFGPTSVDALIEPYIENVLNEHIDARSVRVALNYFELIKWASAHLSVLSADIFYDPPVRPTPVQFPLLEEVLDRQLLMDEYLFLETQILQLNDLSATYEAFGNVMNLPGPADDVDDFDDATDASHL